MNRKLQHTVQALTATVAVFGLLLVAGNPAIPEPAPPGLHVAANADQVPALDSDRDSARTETKAADHVRRNHRAALAMPYFSFAQGGLRRVTGS